MLPCRASRLSASGRSRGSGRSAEKVAASQSRCRTAPLPAGAANPRASVRNWAVSAYRFTIVLPSKIPTIRWSRSSFWKRPCAWWSLRNARAPSTPRSRSRIRSTVVGTRYLATAEVTLSSSGSVWMLRAATQAERLGGQQVGVALRQRPPYQGQVQHPPPVQFAPRGETVGQPQPVVGGAQRQPGAQRAGDLQRLQHGLGALALPADQPVPADRRRVEGDAADVGAANAQRGHLGQRTPRPVRQPGLVHEQQTEAARPALRRGAGQQADQPAAGGVVDQPLLAGDAVALRCRLGDDLAPPSGRCRGRVR